MKWQYVVIYASSFPGVIVDLNQLGAEGWELAGLANGYFYLKRPVIEPEEKAQMEISPKPKRKPAVKKVAKK